MRKRTLFALAGIAALAVPAVVIAGGGGNPGSVPDTGQTTWNTEEAVSTNSKQYKPIRGGLPQGPDFTFDYVFNTSVHVGVDLRGGKAKLRLISNADEVPDDPYPGSVLLAGKGARTVTFVIPQGGLQQPELEWKRVGDDRARAASVAVTALGWID